jgi:chaperonin GroES
MKVQPLHDRLIVKRVDSQEVSKGGIIIPDTAKEKPIEGLVTAVGPGKTLDNGSTKGLTVSEGDKVLFSKYAGTEIKIGGEDHTIMREDDVLGIIVD